MPNCNYCLSFQNVKHMKYVTTLRTLNTYICPYMKMKSVLSSNKFHNFCDLRRRTNVSAVQLYRQKIHHHSSSDPESSRGASVVYAPHCTCWQPHGNRGPATVPSTESQPAVHMPSHRQTELIGLRGTKHIQPHTDRLCVNVSSDDIIARTDNL